MTAPAPSPLAASPLAASPLAPETRTAPARVLVVDGDGARATHLAHALASLGHAARVLPDPGALARLAAHHVDLVVLDAALPGGAADALLHRRAADPALGAVPVLVVAPAAGGDAVARALALGADDFVCEPLHPALLATRVDALLERRTLREAGRRSGRELDIGREIQQGFLPAELPSWPGWELSAHFAAARQVSGDFYDAFMLGGDVLLGVVVGDVCGKGVGAALFMALFRSLIRAVATEVVRTGRTSTLGGGGDRLFTALRIANDYIANVHGSANMFATAFGAAVNPVSGKVRWVNAGHEAALVVGADGGVVARLAPTGAALGLFPDAPMEIGETRLAPGETLLVTTDGVSEARDRSGAFFGEARLEALCAAPVPSAAALVKRVTDAVDAFAGGAEPADDVTLVAVRRGTVTGADAWRAPPVSS